MHYDQHVLQYFAAYKKGDRKRSDWHPCCYDVKHSTALVIKPSDNKTKFSDIIENNLIFNVKIISFD